MAEYPKAVLPRLSSTRARPASVRLIHDHEVAYKNNGVAYKHDGIAYKLVCVYTELYVR